MTRFCRRIVDAVDTKSIQLTQTDEKKWPSTELHIYCIGTAFIVDSLSSEWIVLLCTTFFFNPIIDVYVKVRLNANTRLKRIVTYRSYVRASCVIQFYCVCVRMGGPYKHDQFFDFDSFSFYF